MDEIFDKQELAGFLKVQPRTVNYLLYTKQIPRVKIGREFRFIRSDIEKWLNQRKECGFGVSN
jgi:excisionase family DNA binding protein